MTQPPSSSAAKSLLQQAEAKLCSSKTNSSTRWLTFFFSPHWSGESSIEKAAELFSQAANKFKVEKHCSVFDLYLGSDAGSAFLRMATCYSLLSEADDELSALVSAASCLKKSETPHKALEPLTTAAEGYLNRGRLHTAARQFRNLGDLYEILAGKPIETGTYSTSATDQYFFKAVEAFQKASDIFIGEDAVAAGMLAALCRNFTLSVKIFEEMARQSLSPSLVKWSIKDYLFRASLCMLSSRDYDIPLIDQTLSSDYIPLDSGFASSLECTFIRVLKFDRICSFDAWNSALLLLVKKRFDEESLL